MFWTKGVALNKKEKNSQQSLERSSKVSIVLSNKLQIHVYKIIFRAYIKTQEELPIYGSERCGACLIKFIFYVYSAVTIKELYIRNTERAFRSFKIH